MAASLNLHRNVEPSEADANVRPFVLGVDAFRLCVDLLPSKPFLQIGQQCIPARVLRFRIRRAVVVIDVPMLAPVRRASIANLDGEILQFIEHERGEIACVRRSAVFERPDYLPDVAVPKFALPALPSLIFSSLGAEAVYGRGARRQPKGCGAGRVATM